MSNAGAFDDLCPLGDLVSLVDSKITSGKDDRLPYVGLEHLPSRGADLTGWSTSGSSISTNCIFERNDVLFGKLRPNLRKCLLAPFAGYCSTDILVLRAKEGTNPSFAVRVLQSERVGAIAELTAVGTKMPRTSWRHLGALKVFCPPKSEQTVVAAIMDSLDTSIRETEAIIAKLKAVRQGLLHDLLTRGVDANGELRPPQSEAPQLYKRSPLGWIPKEWGVTAISKLTQVTVGHVGPIESHFCDKDVGLPLLSTTSIGDDGRLRGEHRHVSRFFDDTHANSHLEAGDLIVARHGKSGVTAVVPKSIPSAQSLNVVIIRRSSSFISSFLAAQLNHPETRSRLLGDQAGSVQPIVGTRSVASLEVAMPPCVEQLGIFERIEAVTAKLDSEVGFSAALRESKVGLMDDLLTGRVRVTPLLSTEQQAHTRSA